MLLLSATVLMLLKLLFKAESEISRKVSPTRNLEIQTLHKKGYYKRWEGAISCERQKY